MNPLPEAFGLFCVICFLIWMAFGIGGLLGYQQGRKDASKADDDETNTCLWTHDPIDGGWDSACGDKWLLETGTPAENNMKFCPFCGRKLEVKKG